MCCEEQRSTQGWIRMFDQRAGRQKWTSRKILTWGHLGVFNTTARTPGDGANTLPYGFIKPGEQRWDAKVVIADGKIELKKKKKRWKIGSETVYIPWDEQHYSFTVLHQGNVSSPTFCLNIVQRDLDHLDIPQNITLINYINKIKTWLVF